MKEKWLTEVRKSKVELIYIYIEELSDSVGNKVFSNFSLNLSDSVKAFYDYKTGNLLLSNESNGKPKDFWSFPELKNTSNILNNSLILGENGTGKTTLLEMIMAGSLEALEYSIGAYLLLYSIGSKKDFVIKARNIKWTEKIDISDSPQNNTLADARYTKFFRTPSNDNNSVYIGKVLLDDNQNLIPSVNTNVMTNRLVFKNGLDSFPMNIIYLPLFLGNRQKLGRFVTDKKHVWNPQKYNSFTEIIEFLLEDKRNTNYSIIKSDVLLSIGATSVREIGHSQDEYNQVLNFIYNDKLGLDWRELIHHITENEFANKYFFFYNIWIRLFIRLQLDRFFISEWIDMINFTANESYKVNFQLLNSMFLDFCLQARDNHLKESYFKLIDSIDKLNESLFSENRFFESRPEFDKSTRLVWSINLSDITSNTGLVEFLNCLNTFQNQLNKSLHNTFASWITIDNYCIVSTLGGLSSGEYALIENVFSKIRRYMKELQNNTSRKSKSVLLIMDEPDCTFHIRWSQQFVKYLISFLNKNYPNFFFQIIISSHMPFLATDFPRSNIICLPDSEWLKNNKNNISVQWVSGSELLDDSDSLETNHAINPPYGFMSNYYDLVRDDFFVDSPIGSFAQIKYDQIYKEIQQLSTNNEKNRRTDIEITIRLIDEPVLRKYLQNEYAEKVRELSDYEELQTERLRLEKELQRIQEKLNQMEVKN